MMSDALLSLMVSAVAENGFRTHGFYISQKQKPEDYLTQVI